MVHRKVLQCDEIPIIFFLKKYNVIVYIYVQIQ